MTRKDYTIIAEAIKRAAGKSMKEYKENLVISLVSALKADNESFNKAKFEEACK